jgi:hypothetical protein
VGRDEGQLVGKGMEGVAVGENDGSLVEGLMVGILVGRNVGAGDGPIEGIMDG